MKPLPSSVRESLESATAAFQATLAGGPGERYLRERGIDHATVEKFRLGYVADAKFPGFERFIGRLAIPNICASGHVVYIKFRELPPADSDRKYDGPSLAQRLFNTRALNEADDCIWLTEGEIDAISLGQLGVPAMAVPGNTGWKSHYVRLLEGFERVVLIQDDDEPGAHLAKQMSATHLPLQVVKAPHGFKDVNAALAAGHEDDIRALIEGTTP